MIWNETSHCIDSDTRKGELKVDAMMIDKTLLITINSEAGQYPNLHINEIRIKQRNADLSDRTILDELMEGLEKAIEELHRAEGIANG